MTGRGSILWLVLLGVGVISAPAKAEITTYRLLPGSTIRPMAGAQFTGPAEDLTGAFQWDIYESGSRFAANATYLYFESESYTVTLNTTPLNDVASVIYVEPKETSFSEIVDLTGLSTTTGDITSVFATGMYTGPPYSPDSLLYDDLRIAPIGGGAWCAQLNLVAEPIPEPTTLILFGLGGLLLRKRRR